MNGLDSSRDAKEPLCNEQVGIVPSPGDEAILDIPRILPASTGMGARRRNLAIFTLLSVASIIASLWGIALTYKKTGIILDSRMAYLAGRCLIQHCDPYNEAAMTRVYLAEGGERVTASSHGGTPHYLAAFHVYLPSAEPFFALLALLPWRAAYAIWTALILALITIASFLAWSMAQSYAPDPPFYLAWLLLVNSGLFIAGGNPAGIAVSLCVIATWCILEGRFIAVGMVCLAISLAIKPHDCGLIWIYLVLLGASQHKRAIQSFLVFGVVGVGATVWISNVSPHWVAELRSNLVLLSANGECADPAGPAAISMFNLQTVFAVFNSNSHFYNLATFAVCAVLILIWMFVTVRAPRSPRGIWLGLATITVVSILPIYHRSYDAKILLLTLPACAMLWAEGGLIGWLALFFTGGSILLTSELTAVFQQTLSPASEARGEVLHLLIARPAPLILSAESVFYLYVYVRHYRSVRQKEMSANVPDVLQSAR